MFGKKYTKTDIKKYMSAHESEIHNLYKDKKKMNVFLNKVTNKFNKIKVMKETTVLVLEVKTIINILKEYYFKCFIHSFIQYGTYTIMQQKRNSR